jgi:TonB-linked SusC/RagA family outer membrane protein
MLTSYFLYKKTNFMLTICRTIKPFRIALVSLFIWAAGITQAQDTLMVKGIVYSDTDKPLKDVSISIAGSLEMPVLTNDAGEFTVMSTSGEDWLILSPTGDYKAKRIYLNYRQQLNIYLTPADVFSGDDLVNILERPVAKRNIAAAFTPVDLKDLDHTGAMSIDLYLAGRVAGLNVISGSGMPGSGAFMNLRGINSLNAGIQPLVLIDGIPVTPTGIFGSGIQGFSFNPLLEMNTFDISKVTVVKDPAISAAYGSRGSNGLILVETLDPSVTQTTIELDLRSGLSLSPANLIPQLNAGQHKTLINETLFTSGKFEEDIVEEYPSLFYTADDAEYINYQHNTNWQKEIFNNSSFYNLNVNVKGGDEIATYGLSFGFINSSGTIKQTSYSGYNLRFVSRLNVFDWLKMNAGVSLNYNRSKLKDAASSKETSPILTSLAKSPMLNPYQYDEQGQEISAFTEVDELGVSNPVAVLNNYEAKNTNSTFVFAMGAEAFVTRNIMLKSKFSMTYSILKEQMFLPNHGMEHYYNDEAYNVSQAGNNDLKTFYNNTYLSYNKTLGENQVISSMTGFNLQTNKFEYDWGLTKNSPENDQYRALDQGQDNLREIGGQNRAWNWFSLYENLVYTFKDKYLVTASLSLDGSSRVGDNADNTIKVGSVPFGFFYSGGIAWRLSSENFLKNKGWLEELKWRLSYGKTGNDDIGESSASRYYKTVKFYRTAGLYPAVVSNEKLTYETVTQLNTGIDIAVWGNRIRASVDVFQAQTKNMLIFSPISAYLGEDYRMENSGKMRNRGWEVSAFGRIKDNGNFKWDVQLTLSNVKSEVIDIKGDKLITKLQGAEIVNMEGAPVNSFYGYIFKGVYANSDQAATSNLVNDKFRPYSAGDAIFEDLSGPSGTPDGIINQYDKTSIGSTLPDYIGSLFNVFYYKKFALSTMIQLVKGNEVYNYVRFRNEQMSGLQNQSVTTLNRWQYEDQVTNIPRALWQDPMGNSAFSTRWIEDGSFVRVKNITLSYTIPEKFLSFRNAEFYIAASNLFTFTKYLGYDPEFSFSYSQNEQGIDYGMTPQVRQFIAGIKVGL